MPRVRMLVPSTEEGAVGQSARPVGKDPTEGTALAEGLQCRQSLHRIEELFTERLERLLTLARCQAGTLMDDGRRHESEQRGAEHHSGDGEVPVRHEGEDCHRRAGGDRDLGNVLAEEGLQLLDAVDDRQHHAAGAFGTKPYRAEGDDLVVQPHAQRLLHAGCGTVSNHGAKVVEAGAQQNRSEDADQGDDQLRRSVPRGTAWRETGRGRRSARCQRRAPAGRAGCRGRSGPAGLASFATVSDRNARPPPAMRAHSGRPRQCRANARFSTAVELY